MKFLKLTKHKKKIAMILIVITVAFITCVVLSLVIKKNQDLKAANAKKPSPSYIYNETPLVNKSPDSGPLNYSPAYGEYGRSSGSSNQFVYTTTERRDERLVAMNDEIIKKLKDAGVITDKTTTYSIEYFDNLDIAKSYFETVNNPKNSVEEKAKLKKYYVAKMVYAGKYNISFLIRIGNGAILKKY